MPWKHIPPDSAAAILQFLGLVVAGVVGSASRIAQQINRGERAKVWGKELAVDVTSLAIMLLISYGICDYFELGLGASVAVTGILCRQGTDLLDEGIKVILSRIGKM